MLLRIDLVKFISPLQNRVLISRHQVARTDNFALLHPLSVQAKEMQVFVIFFYPSNDSAKYEIN